MTEFTRSPSSGSSSSVKGTKSISTMPVSSGSPLPMSSPRRQSLSAAVFGGQNRNSCTAFSVPATSIFTYSTPPPVRRNSNPTGSSSSGFCSYSPNESRTQSLELKCRRYSQPSSPSRYSAIADPLIRQEKASYSSLSFLPEVQTYLHFMEDTTSTNSTTHQRSNSFNGRNSLRSGFRRERARSQSRSPASADGEEDETSFSQSSAKSQPVTMDNRPYGQYLTPSRSASLEAQVQHHAPPVGATRQMSLGNSTEPAAHGSRQRRPATQAQVQVAEPLPEVSPSDDPVDENQEQEQTTTADEEQGEPIFRRCFERRRSSTIRTSFI